LFSPLFAYNKPVKENQNKNADKTEILSLYVYKTLSGILHSRCPFHIDRMWFGNLRAFPFKHSPEKGTDL